MNILTKTLLGSALSTAMLAGIAPSAMAGGNPIMDSSTVEIAPQYLHLAASGGYDEATCNNTLMNLQGLIPGASNGEVSPSVVSVETTDSCWKMPNGKWTYGSFGFTTRAAVSKSLAASFPTKYAAKPNTLSHSGAKYPTLESCESNRASAIATIYAAKGTVQQAGSCFEVDGPSIKDKTGKTQSYTAYGRITYTMPTSGSKVFGNDAAVKSSYFNTSFTYLYPW